MKDLEDAATQESFAQIADVRAGTDDGTVNFVFKSAALPTGVIMIEALIPGTCIFGFSAWKFSTDLLAEVSDYPNDHMYFLYTTSSSGHVPPPL